MGGKPSNSKPKAKQSYAKPKIKRLGHIADVTLKSGADPDINQTTKPGQGGG